MEKIINNKTVEYTYGQPRLMTQDLAGLVDQLVELVASVVVELAQLVVGTVGDGTGSVRVDHLLEIKHRRHIMLVIISGEIELALLDVHHHLGLLQDGLAMAGVEGHLIKGVSSHCRKEVMKRKSTR